jgi:Ca2+-binding EF-hand superfamily protein
MQNGRVRPHQFVICVDFMHPNNFQLGEILDLFKAIDTKSDGQIDSQEFSYYFRDLFRGKSETNSVITSVYHDYSTNSTASKQISLTSTKRKLQIKGDQIQRANSVLRTIKVPSHGFETP